ncbi:MAG TPA: flagellar export chaperone FliS [Sandaracinaceae bacterium LLY-WYZ-13_1]|nr:flagellar export chaperone FliS [Sandaracinaceae bacterium LLY-WYZ-13_1]
MSFAVAQYQTARTQTASPVQIVVDLYRGAVRFMRQAQAFEDQGDAAGRGRALSKAHAIVSELQATLDHEQAPELCEELDRLYDFVLHRITETNVQADVELLGAAIDVMGKLENAWAQLAGRA